MTNFALWQSAKAIYMRPMTITPGSVPLSAPDLGALILFVVLVALIGWVVEHPPRARPSVSVLMARYRREWMRQFVTRQPRIFDASVLEGLRQATAFFASACMIALGGGVALIGNAEQLHSVAQDLTLAQAGVALEWKLILVLIFVANGLLKFIWSHRLFGYCAILMASVPNDTDDPRAYPMAAQAAEINVTAARNFNRGLRSVYYALGALGWLLGPWTLIATTLLTAATMLRREFASESRAVILAGQTLP